MYERFILATVIGVFGVFAASIVPVAAADAGAVLAACDRTPGCSYAQSKDGSIQGCSSQSGVCFDCPVDGKKQCNSTTLTVTPSNTFGGVDNVAGMLKNVENPDPRLPAKRKPGIGGALPDAKLIK